MRLVICGHFNLDLKKFDFSEFPFFKSMAGIKPPAHKYPSFSAPFIFSEDCLKATELPGKLWLSKGLVS